MHLQLKSRSSGLSHGCDRNTYALALSFPERASRTSVDRGGHGGAVGWNYVSASEDRQVGKGSANGPKAQVPQLLGIRPSQPEQEKPEHSGCRRLRETGTNHPMLILSRSVSTYQLKDSSGGLEPEAQDQEQDPSENENFNV